MGYGMKETLSNPRLPIHLDSRWQCSNIYITLALDVFVDLGFLIFYIIVTDFGHFRYNYFPYNIA